MRINGYHDESAARTIERENGLGAVEIRRAVHEHRHRLTENTLRDPACTCRSAARTGFGSGSIR